jgi:hypothetical protein
MSEFHGHMTMIDGSHRHLSETEASDPWKAIQVVRSEREARLPGVEECLIAINDAQSRMNDLGWWRAGGFRVKAGDECAVAESGSTGIWSGFVDAERKYVHYAGSVSSPQKVWLKPIGDLTDDERALMEKCDQAEREHMEAELARYAAMDAADQQGD